MSYIQKYSWHTVRVLSLPVRYWLEIFKKLHETKKNYENDAVFYLRKISTFSNKYIINRDKMDSNVIYFDTKHIDMAEVKYHRSQDQRDLLR